MLTRAGRKLVERTLGYISEREKAVWKLTTVESDNLRVAWWTVWFAAYQEAERPHDAALRKVLGPRYQKYRETHNTLPAIYTGPGSEPADVDGRNGRQWVQSVLTYLDWRSGSSWRPMTDRNHPERRAYTDASLQLRQAFNAPNQLPEQFRTATRVTHSVEPIAPPAIAPKRRAR